MFVVGLQMDLEKPAPYCLAAWPFYKWPMSLISALTCRESHQDKGLKHEEGAFIGQRLEVQEAFSFTVPSEVLGAVKLYCGDLYGGMLARRDSPEATKLMNRGGTSV